MSVLDFATDLFHDPENLRAFIEDADQSLRDAGLPEATPEQVYELLPTIAESMPPDHPLQAVVQAPDPQAALRELDVDHFGDLESDVHLSGKIKMDDDLDVGIADKAVAGAQDAEQVLIVDSPEDGKWRSATENDKGVGDQPDVDLPDANLVRVVDDPETPEIEVAFVEPGENRDLDEPGVDPDSSAATWDKALDG
jgi:hypothetical protein